jgi:hypothetical protein
MRAGVTLILALLGAIVAAAELAVPAELAALGWRSFGFDGKAANRYRLVEPDTVEVESESSASLLYRPVAPDFAQTGCLAWRWRVDRTMPPTDLARKGGDDRPLALYVSFRYDAVEASVQERMQRALVELAQGRDAPGQVLIYVWGGKVPRGSVLVSPYLGNYGALVVLRRGDAPTGEWFDEQVDVAADYARIFQRKAVAPYQIAIGADSDDTRATSLARIADIRFAAC